MAQSPAGGPRYPIRAVARMAGIPAATLRSWERRYGFPVPARSGTLRRLYSQADVDAIRWLKSQLGLGLSIGQAVEWYRSGRGPAIAAAPREEAAPPGVAPGRAGGEASGFDQFLRATLDAVVAYDEARLEAVLSSAFAVHPPDRVLTELIVPAQHEVGARWHDGTLSVAAEHFASNVFRRRIFMLLSQMPVSNLGPHAVLACVPGEEHDLGLLMLALFLRWQGLRPLYLGASVPQAYLLQCLRETQSAALCLSAVTTNSAPALLETAAQITRAGTGVRMFAGGAGSHAVQLGAGVLTLGDDLHGAAATIASALGFSSPPPASLCR
jgi:methanogenic corrinoid protein MtbC1